MLTAFPPTTKTNQLFIKWIRTSRRNPCPVCGKSGWCEISDSGQVAHCMHQAAGGRPGQHRGGGWFHDLGLGLGLGISPLDMQATAADLRRPTPTPTPTAAPEIIPLDPAVINQVNQAFLGMLELAPEHRLYLEIAGLADRWISRCKTLSYKQASKLAQRLVDRFGSAVCERHPLIIKPTARDGRSWWTIAGAADGILFPALNLEGQILGIQLRKDEPKGQDDRYIWLSHAGLGGTPLTVFQALPGAANSHMVIITEGYKKAAIATEKWECNSISVAGVSAYKEMELAHSIEQLEASLIILAFDQDKRLKPQVQRAENQLVKLLTAMLPETSILILNWDLEQGKGLDDALAALAEFNLERAVVSGPRYSTDLPGEAHARSFGKFKPFYSLAEARSEHRKFFNRLLARPDGSKTALTSPTGTGKSQAADDELAEALLSSRLEGRWLLMAPNKANIIERTKRGTLLGRAVTSGLAVIQLGRNLIDLADPAQVRTSYDCANPQAQEAGAVRQIAAKVICKTCPFGSAENWQREFGGQARTFRCEIDGYIGSRKRSFKSRLVIATKESFLNGSDQLGDFDGIICDEDLLNYLLETIEIDSNVLAGWREKIAVKNINAPSWEKLFKVFEAAFDNLAITHKDDKGLGNLIDCQKPLEAAAGALGFDYALLLWECGTRTAQNLDGDFYFEIPYQHNNKLVLPFRGAQELLDRLSDPANPARFSRGGDGSFKLVLHVPRTNLIKIFQEKTVVVLDATVSPVLNFYLPKLHEISYNVRQNLYITQITNALYSKQDLYNPVTRAHIAAVNKSFATGSRNHLTIMPLRFKEGNEALETPAGSQVEHWGMHRATSRYSDCDSISLVGHHIRPIDHIRAEVQAARAFAGEQAREAKGAEQKLRLYNHLLPNGRAAGRWMRQNSDPDVQAAIEHEYAANIIQAIGRLRAALRPAHLPPARVLILCNEPAGDLSVDCLSTSDEMITNPPESQLFINNIYMKMDKKGGLVPTYTAVMEDRGVWDDGLVQDETAETQNYFVEDWPFNDPWQLE